MKEKNKEFSRICPRCKKEIFYTNKKNRNQAIKRNKVCRECSPFLNTQKIEKNKLKIQKQYLKFDEERNNKILEIFEENKTNWKKCRSKILLLYRKFLKGVKPEKYYRNCPECNKLLTYQSKSSLNLSEKDKCLCKSCSQTGEKNGFYNKKHSQKTINKILKTKETSESYKKYLENQRSEESRKKTSERFSGDKNPRWKKGSLKDIWTKKYGEEEGNKRDLDWKSKLSIATSGSNNPMYGKPSPQGSGNGWSGWYKGWFFRSLRELSYMIEEIEVKGLSWENGEKKKFKIRYIDYAGKERNYFPDFVVEGKIMVECKPVRLHTARTVIDKRLAAEIFCQERGLEYILISPNIISPLRIKELYLSGEIKFTERYEKKFIEKYLKKEKIEY